MISVPILTKFYDPESFGRFSYITSLSILLASVQCLGLQKSLLRTNQKIKLNKYLNYVLAIIILSTTIALLLLIFLPFKLEYIILCLLAFFTSINELFKFYFLSLSNLKPILLTKYSSSVLSPISKMFFFLTSVSSKGLLLGQLVEKIFTSIVSLYYSKVTFQLPRFKDILAFAKNNIDFIKFSLPSTFLNISSSNLLVYVLPFYFSFEILGYYFLANKILNIPTSSVGKLVSEFFTSKYIKSTNKKKLLNKTVKNLVFVSLPLFLLIFILSESLIDFFFEKQWNFASVLIKILIPLHFFRFISSPCSYIFEIEKKNHVLFKFNFFYLLVTLISVFSLTIFELNINNFLILYSLLGSIIYLYLLQLSKKIL